MPPLVTWRGTICEKRWNVGPDDFVLPVLIAIVVAMFNISLISAALLAVCLPGTPDIQTDSCNTSNISDAANTSDTSTCIHCRPIITVPLSILGVLEIAFAWSEGMILIFSTLGPIVKKTRKSKLRNMLIPYLIAVHALISVGRLLAVIASAVCLYRFYHIPCEGNCIELTPRIKFAQAVVTIQLITFIFYILKTCAFTDPFGITTPSLLAKVDLQSISTNGYGAIHLAPYVTVRTQGKHLDDQIYKDDIFLNQQKRRLRSIFCCLGVRGQVAEPVAIEDGARLLYSVFGETKFVLSDLLAGFALLRKYQQEKKKEGEMALTRKFRMVMFQKMSKIQREDLVPELMRNDSSFDYKNICNQLLLEDLVYFMKYAMGVFGWPLYIHDHTTCGVCQLCPVTCCRCKCYHDHSEEEKFIGDNICMCNIGAFRLSTGVKEVDILYASFDNSVYLAPYIVCMDHKIKALVISVRGSTSFKDLLTCMSFSPLKLEMTEVEGAYVHGGMYKAALNILNNLLDKDLLTKPFQDHPDYQVVVTGHSLGAGVASILIILIQQELECSGSVLKCYAYSPPGGLLSFPLAEHSKSFITTVVLGNDMIPRLSLHGLLHLKESIMNVLQTSDLPKYQILLCSRKEGCKKCCMTRNRSNSPTKRYRGDIEQPNLQEEDNFEDNIFDEKTTLAEVREKVFGEATGIQPEIPRSKLRRQSIFRPQRTQSREDMITDAVTLVSPETPPISKAPANKTRRISRTVTPGGIIAMVSSSMERHCRVDEGKIFLPCFLPGKLLHLKIKRRWLGRNQFEMKEVPRENMSVIIVDEGMRSDHFVTTVCKALQDFKSSICDSFNYDEVEKMRKLESIRKMERNNGMGKERHASFHTPPASKTERERQTERERPTAVNSREVYRNEGHRGLGRKIKKISVISECDSAAERSSAVDLHNNGTDLRTSENVADSFISFHGDCWLP